MVPIGRFPIKDEPQATRALKFIQLQLMELAKDCDNKLKNGQVSPNCFVELETQLEKILHETRAACKPPPTKPAKRDFIIIREVSRGTFGTVNLVWHIKTKEIFAMKHIALKYPNQRDDVLLERDMLTYLDHPLVVPMYCSFETVGQMYMTMEYVKGGDLKDLLENERHFRMDKARFYMAELVLAVEYIHSYGILHMDLKPSNLLITKEGHIKVADFGLSKIGSVSTADLMTEADCRRNAREFTDIEAGGTPVFMAPELYLKTGYGKPVDWWSAGVILYNLLYGVLPFNGKNRKEVAKLVTEDDIHFPDGEHPSREFARQLISGLLEKDPVRRLGTRGASEVKRHPFFQGVDWKKLPYETAPYVPDVKKMFSCTPLKLHLTSSDSDDDYDEPPTGQTNFCTVAFRFNKVYGSPMPLSPCTPMNRRLLSAKPGDSKAKKEQQEIEASDEGFSDEEGIDEMDFSGAWFGQSGQGESQSDNSSPPLHHSAPGQMDSVYFDSDSDGEDNSKFNFRLPCLRQSGRDASQSDSAPTPAPRHAAPVQMDSEYIDRDSEWEDISQNSSEASLRQSGRDESQSDSAPTPAPRHAAPVQMDSEYIDRDSEWEDISQNSSEASLRQSGRDASQSDSAPTPAPRHAAPVQMDSEYIDRDSEWEDISQHSSEASLRQSGRDESQCDSAPTPAPRHAAPVQMDSEYIDRDSEWEDISQHTSEASLRQSGRDESQSDSAPTPAPRHAAPVQMDSEYIDRDSEWEDISQHSSEASLRQSGQDESQCDSAPSPAPHHASPVQMDPVEECLSEDLLDATWSLLDIQLQMAELARDLNNTLQNDLVRPNYFMELHSQLVDIRQETREACNPTVEDVSSEEDREPNSQGRWPPTQSPVLLKVSTR